MISFHRIAAKGCMLLILFGGVSTAQAKPRPAELIVEGDILCTYPNFTDHQISTDHYAFTLPDGDGPVSSQGEYVNNGTGYTLAGPAAMSGEVHGTELILTYRQWNYNGEWMYSEAPFVPTGSQPVTVPLQPGGEAVVQFQNAGSAPGVSCSGVIIYRIEFQP